MIRKVSFSNFYSFKGSQTIDFTTTKKEGYSYYHSDTGRQITKIASFIGGNGSGKTNVIRLFSFFRYFICRKTSGNSTHILPKGYKTFFNNKDESSFDIEFEVNSTIYFYHATLILNNIIKEELRYKRNIKNAKTVSIFLREDKEIKLNNKIFVGITKPFLKKIKNDISLIAYIETHHSVDRIGNVYKFFTGFKTNINEVGEINTVHQQFKTLEKYLEDKELKGQMDKLVTQFDMGLSGFEIRKEIRGEEVSITVDGVHETGKGKNKLLNFVYESRGTRSLFFVLGNILSALKNNSVVILDEIETGFHYETLNKLISYFIDENEGGSAQLILSSHSLGFLNRLDMHQIYLVEKDQRSISVCNRLNSIDGVRSDDNFRAKYLSGGYGAFPEIII